MSINEYNDLGRFNVNDIAIPSNGVIKHLIETHDICTDVDLNTMHRVYELRFEETTRPIDIRSSYIRVRGTVGGMDVDNAYHTIDHFVPNNHTSKIILTPGWIYNAFEEMRLLIDNQNIETVREPRATMMMKAHLQHDWEGLVGDTYTSACLYDREMCDTYEAFSDPGEYSRVNRSHLISASGAFEFLIPLGLLFETVRTLPAHYMHLLPVIQLKRSSKTASGINTDIPALTPEIHFDCLELVYNEIVFNDGIDTKKVEQQYYAPSIVSIPHRKWDSQTITYNTSRINTKLSLTPSKHGNSAMIIAWYEDVPAQTAAVNGPGYWHDRLKLINLEASYGGVKVCDMQRLDDGAYLGAGHVNELDGPEAAEQVCPNVKRVYEQFKKNLQITYSDSTLSMDYETFRQRRPYVFIDLSKYNLGGNEEIARMLNVSITHNVTKNYKMIIWLLSNEVTILNPRNGDLLVTGGL